MLKLIFKALYVIRKKIQGFVFKVRMMELKYVFGDRVILPAESYFSILPEFIFDNSKSKAVIDNKVASRGKLTLLFYNDGVIEIGQSTFFNNDCSINALLHIQIGVDCLFGENVKIYDHNHQYKNLSLPIKDQGYTMAPVKIGNNCWIGSNVVILKGVTIGDNCVVGANSVVHKSLPANSVSINVAESRVTSYSY
jgi:acetyltransferase-like isoleucine patch superfamily enzyme